MIVSYTPACYGNKGQYEFEHTTESFGEVYAPSLLKLTKVTPSGVKVNLAEKIIFFILLISAQLIHFYCVALIL